MQSKALAISVALLALAAVAFGLLHFQPAGNAATSVPLETATTAAASSLPSQPVAVALPELTANDRPGPAWDSAPAHWPGRGIDHYGYETAEYVITGTATGQPYRTRLVVRRPADASRFSGMVIAEAMHPVGRAHAFQYNSVYLMDAGHVNVEVSTRGIEQIAAFNAERYGDHRIADAQINEVLAQAGALIRSDGSPIADLDIRGMILWGTSASSRILTDYLPAHAVFKTAAMENIYDGFMPTSNGSDIAPVDVPMIQVPTQHEFENIATARQDGDAPGAQFRVYEFPGMGHLMARHNERLSPGDCVHPLSNYPLEAYMSVALHHLLEWVDKGTLPPRADRVWIDRNVGNDGSLMLLDEYGNPRGGIRSPYVDVPVAAYTARNEPLNEAAATGCRLSVWDRPFTEEELRELYGSREEFLRRFAESLNAQEAAGWSLPVYHDLIMADAEAMQF